MESRHQPNSSPNRRRTMALCSTALGFVVAAAAALAAVGVSAAPAKTPVFKLLYTFTGTTDGAVPYAGLVADKAGNLYGTTFGAGAGGCGTVFKLAPGGIMTTLHGFPSNNGTDGCDPYAGVILDKAGNLYGTTYGGGADNRGAVFKLATDGTETVLYSFTGGSDGGSPVSGLLERHGNLFGMTSQGGTYGYGVVFKVASDGTEKVLHAFQGGADGATPLYNALIADATGNLYGTTNSGGSGSSGTVFKLAGHTETVLYAFTGGSDGGYPAAALILDTAGNLYGTTASGGTSGPGAVFKLAPDGTETVLYSFTGGSDGGFPLGGLSKDAVGNFYGTTGYGGTGGSGTVYKIAPDGTETVLYSLNGASDGSTPYGGLIKAGANQKGALFGTTSGGGTYSGGTVFSITK